jgi:hypothetical protein
MALPRRGRSQAGKPGRPATRIFRGKAKWNGLIVSVAGLLALISILPLASATHVSLKHPYAVGCQANGQPTNQGVTVSGGSVGNSLAHPSLALGVINQSIGWAKSPPSNSYQETFQFMRISCYTSNGAPATVWFNGSGTYNYTLSALRCPSTASGNVIVYADFHNTTFPYYPILPNPHQQIWSNSVSCPGYHNSLPTLFGFSVKAGPVALTNGQSYDFYWSVWTNETTTAGEGGSSYTYSVWNANLQSIECACP